MDYSGGQGVDDAQEHVNTKVEEVPEGMEAGGGKVAARADLPAMQAALTALEPLDSSGRSRVFAWLAAALDLEAPVHRPVHGEPVFPAATAQQTVNATIPDEEGVPSPREFVSRKKPASLVERVACLAYYLAHYRNVAHFRSGDIVDLNVEAAGSKFGNPSRDIDNADRQSGYVVTAGNGAKQLTVRGEALVDALPEREAVKAALREHPFKTRKRDGSNKKSTANDGGIGD